MSKYDDKLLLLSSFCYICILLTIGKWLRVTFRCFQVLYMPSSILGGLIGMVIGQTLAFTWSDGSEFYETYFTAGWGELPGFLINIVFTSVFIGVSLPSVGQVWRQAGPQLMYGQILSWGMYAVAAATCGIMSLILYFTKGETLNPLFASVLPIGFEGGHGTVAGLKSTYESLDFKSGVDFGLASSTLGMIVGLLIALALVNIAARLGWMEKIETGENTFDDMTARGIYNWDNRPVAGHQTVMSDSIDTLSLHVCAIGVGMAIAYVTKRILLEIEGHVPILEKYAVFESFPVFALCMVGGIIVQKLLETFTRGLYIDSEMMQRVSGLSLDFLVVAAIAKVSLDTFTGEWQQIVAFAILMIMGFVWHIFCLVVIAPRVLPDYPFQRAIAQLGHSTGTTATGLLLLKMVDPMAETTAHGAFAFMLLLHEPPMSGGLYTSLPILVLRIGKDWGNLIVVVMCLVIIVFWLLLYRCHFLRRYPQKPTGSLVSRSLKVDDEMSNDPLSRPILSEPLIVVGGVGGGKSRRPSEAPSI